MCVCAHTLGCFVGVFTLSESMACQSPPCLHLHSEIHDFSAWKQMSIKSLCQAVAKDYIHFHLLPRHVLNIVSD